jgi:hypothetical protein
VNRIRSNRHRPNRWQPKAPFSTSDPSLVQIETGK